MKENAIEIKNLCISYRGLKSYSIKKSLLHFHRNKVDEFQAIRNVSFNVPKGNILGIVGKNGSGKSTMLNAIAGIFAPDSGTIDLKGNSVSLLSIGISERIDGT
jgi:teichoic acid transport system ATP-binding protein